MKPLHASLLVLGAAGCAPGDRAASEIHDERPIVAVQSAHGENPFWHLTVGEDRIGLILDPGGRGREADLSRTTYAPVRFSRSGGVKRWQAGRGTAVIDVEVRDGPCVVSGAQYREVARVRLSGRELVGCGGTPPFVRPL